jgi:hypothetical protein
MPNCTNLDSAGIKRCEQRTESQELGARNLEIPKFDLKVLHSFNNGLAE